MVVCLRCTMDQRWDAQICIGCGNILGTAVAPGSTAIPSIVPPPAEAPVNPWRQPQAVPAEPVASAPEVGAPMPVADDEEETPFGIPPKTTAKLAEGVPQAPLGEPIKLTFDNPLPDIDPDAPQAVPGPIRQAVDVPAIPVVPSEEAGTVRGVVQPAEDTLAVPAAYASFASEPASLEDFAIKEDEPAAEVVELSFPSVLTVAPPATHTPGWVDGPAAVVAGDEHASRAANSRWVGSV